MSQAATQSDGGGSEEMQELRNSFEITLKNNLPDFSIIAGSKGQHIWRVHSKVLARHSGFFRALLESEFKEAVEKKIRLPEDDPVSIACIVIWMYYDQFPFNVNGSHTDLPLLKMLSEAEPGVIENLMWAYGDWYVGESRAEVFISMYEAAEKYDIEALKKETVKRLEDMVRKNDDVFWTLRDYVAKSEFNCKPFEEILKIARSENVFSLRLDDRYREVLEEDRDFCWKTFSMVAQDRDQLAITLTETSQKLKKTEQKLSKAVKKLSNAEKKLRSGQNEVDQVALRRLTLRTKPENGRTGTNGSENMIAGLPVCYECGTAGHMARDCPRQ